MATYLFKREIGPDQDYGLEDKNNANEYVFNFHVREYEHEQQTVEDIEHHTKHARKHIKSFKVDITVNIFICFALVNVEVGQVHLDALQEKQILDVVDAAVELERPPNHDADIQVDDELEDFHCVLKPIFVSLLREDDEDCPYEVVRDHHHHPDACDSKPVQDRAFHLLQPFSLFLGLLFRVVVAAHC